MGEKERIPVAVTCRAHGLSKQAPYPWKNNPWSRRDWDEAHLINTALDIHLGDPAFWWLTDITEHPTAEVKLYLCTNKVFCPAWIVGYSRRGQFSIRR